MTGYAILLAKEGPPPPLSDVEAALAVSAVLAGILLAVVLAAVRARGLRRRRTSP